MKWLAVVVVCAACKQGSDAPAPTTTAPAPVMAASEARRDQDACKAYIAKVCACAETMPPMAQTCRLARPLLDALQVALDVAANPESARRDAVQANDSARRIAKECIEQTAKLAGAGCP